MGFWKYRSCPKCSGDLYVEREQFHWAVSCLQCGARRYVPAAKNSSGSGGSAKQNEPAIRDVMSGTNVN